MARMKIKVEFRLNGLLGQLRELRARESDPDVQEFMRQLIFKQANILEWVNVNMPDGNGKRLASRKSVAGKVDPLEGEPGTAGAQADKDASPDATAW